MRTCGNCNEILLRKDQKKFCSKRCANIYNNTKNPKRKPKDRICERCGQKFTKQKNASISRYCYRCRDEIANRNVKYKKYTLGELTNQLSVKHKHPSWKYAEVRNLNRSWNKELMNKPCNICGYNKHVELAHIIPISKFPETATIGEINSPQNVVQLCRNCHWEFDHGVVALSS